MEGIDSDRVGAAPVVKKVRESVALAGLLHGHSKVVHVVDLPTHSFKTLTMMPPRGSCKRWITRPLASKWINSASNGMSHRVRWKQ